MGHLHLTTTIFYFIFLNPGSDRGSASCGIVGTVVDIIALPSTVECC